LKGYSERLELVTRTYRRDSMQDNVMRRLCVRVMEPWLRTSGVGLEIGCSDGMMSELLAVRVKRLEVIEAAKAFVDLLRARNLPNVIAHHSLIENFHPAEKFDYVFATWVLTHVADLKTVFSRIKRVLAPGGLLFVAVPNVRVLSRQLSLHMGLIGDLLELTENDRNHGHVRAFDRATLNRELTANGFESLAQGGLMLKPLADFQMDQLYEKGVLHDAHVEGLFQLGCLYPDLASAIYSVCRLKS
jgi:2-polyprenyl-3-methyl-5-hydroxy-6-metoxy-1,4-benzoquinol methylase